MAIKSDKFENHCIEMAKIAVKVGAVMDLKNDALQACFATILISGDKHGVFLEPVPRDTKTPVIPETAVAVGVTEKQKGVLDRDVAAAAKADEQIKDVPRVTTAEQDQGARRSSFLDAITSARELLNKEGFTPPVTPAGLIKLINEDLKIPGNLGTIDVDQLEKVIMYLSEKLDTFRANKKIAEEDAPF